jgi:membrane protein
MTAENIAPIFIAIAGGLLIEAFFQLVKYKDSLNSNNPISYVSFVSNYLSVRQFVSYGRRKWVNYFLFRTLPVAVIVLLVVSIEQRYFKVNQPWSYAFWAAIVSLLFRDIWGIFKKRKFISERLIHITNVLLVICTGTFIGLMGNWFNLSIIAPSSIANLLDNLWSSMIVAMLVLFYFRVTNMGSSHNVAEDENNIAFTNYVVRALGDIYDNYHESIDLFCRDESCNKLLLYSILVYEDMNRPLVIRKIENAIVTFLKCELTVGIAQVKSKKPLTDVESIKIAARILRNTNSYDMYDAAEIKRVVGVYNSGKVYAQTIVEIMNIIRQDSRIEDVNKLYQ